MANIIGELDLKLETSKIQGIGVFANKNLKKGTKLLFDKELRKISAKEAKKDKKLFERCERFGVETKEGYVCPKNFGEMSFAWFLNHSKKPNLKTGSDAFILSRDIKEGEELTVDYNELDEGVPNAEYMGEKLK